MRQKKKFFAFGPGWVITAARAIHKKRHGKLNRNSPESFPKRERKFFRSLESANTQLRQSQASHSMKNALCLMAMSRACFRGSVPFEEICMRQKDGDHFRKKRIVCSIEILPATGIKS